MKSNISQTPLRTYSRLPKSWPARPNLINYDKADQSIHYEDGWRDVIIPNYNSNTQKLGSLIIVNDSVTYDVLNLNQQELDQKAEQELDSDNSAQKLNQSISDGQLMFQRFFTYLQRLFDNGQITGSEARNSAQRLFLPLLPINYGQFLLAKLNLDGLQNPTNQKELAILNKAKEHINNYLTK